MFMAMAYYSGGNLESKMAGKGWSESQAFDMALQIAEGLEVRGLWVPDDIYGPDLITAIFSALNATVEQESDVVRLSYDAGFLAGKRLVTPTKD